MKPAVIERIKKLLALANSDNEAEAQLAAKKAQELMIKYNLSMEGLDEQSENAGFAREDIDLNRQRRPKETFFIHWILERFYFVKVVNRNQHKETRPGYRKFGARGQKITVLLGKPHNIEIAKYVSEFLHRAFKDLWTSYRERTGSPVSSRDAFFMGLYEGIKEQLIESERKITEEKFSTPSGATKTGAELMVIQNHALQLFVKEQFPELGSPPPLGVNATDYFARHAGKEHGKNLNISRGLGSKGSGNGGLIGG